MAKEEATVEELVGKIERGELQLPEMQRRYVWRATRVRDLLDSLYRGYPSGAILLWETDEEVPLQDFAVPQLANSTKARRLLLDGQQRLTSLAAVIRGHKVTVRGRQRPIELLFNLEHEERSNLVTEVNEDSDEDASEAEADASDAELQERLNRMTFVVATRQLESMPQWVRVSDVFRTDEDAPFLKAAGVTSFDDPRYTTYSRRLARLRGIRKYAYRMDVLERGLSYEEVTEIFVRVNSLGAKLRSSDLALAQITAKWRGSLAVFDAFQQQCAKSGFDVELGIHLKNLVASATGQSRFLTVGGLTAATLQSSWEHCMQGFEFAMNFARNNAGIESPSLLSSPFLLVTLAYWAQARHHEVEDPEACAMRRWLLLANAKGRYSRGSSETLLDQDLAVLRAGGGPEELLERLRLHVGRLDVQPAELEGRSQRSALFKTMFLAFRQDGAKDWSSNIGIALDLAGTKHKLQFHHIFPKKLLRERGVHAREIDDIANLAFVSGKTNRSIAAKHPRDYLPALAQGAGASSLRAQCIPDDPALLELDRFPDFLEARRSLIAARLERFLSE